MEIYPAVDLYDGKVVRLERGDFHKMKVYSEDPGGIAAKWATEGARWLHVVDLEGARDGKIRNWEALERIVDSSKASVQFGGGVRSEEDICRLVERDIKRVVLGTKAIDFKFIKKMSEAYEDRLALSLDLRGTEIQIEGWLKGSGRSVFDFLAELGEIKLGALIVTDIQRDGVLEGMNLPLIQNFLEHSPCPVIASGGVASLEDLKGLKALPRKNRLEGVIIGKALYEGQIDLKEALRLSRGET